MFALPISGWAREISVDPFDTEQYSRWLKVVPLPVRQETGRKAELWEVAVEVLVDWTELAEVERVALADRLNLTWRPLGRTWRACEPGEDAQIRFSLHGPKGEGYQLSVSPSGVAIEAADAAGRYYALVTLAQLLPPLARSVDVVSVACGTVKDNPAYTWRGLMLDSSRHFQSVETLESILELMALHKLNRFHWHLTDDQGWRLEVPSWPRLTEVGAWRTEVDGSVYGGFYTQEDIRRVVAFAAQRQIVVVPEIDLPGHSSAALAAYPELSATGLGREVPLDWGVADGVLSIGRSSVARFTADVLTTLVDLFPGPWIHWGGDEVYRTPWMKNKESLAWMKTVKAQTADQALAAFWADLAARTLKAGKIPVGWDDVVVGPLPAGTVIQWWDDPKRGLAALKKGHPVIASWKETTYLDYPELDSDGDRAWWMPAQTLATVAKQPFWPPGTDVKARPLIQGLEATLWSERVTEGKWGRKLFPRLALVAELAWRGTPGGVPGWPSRLEDHRIRLEAWGVGMPPALR